MLQKNIEIQKIKNKVHLLHKDLQGFSQQDEPSTIALNCKQICCRIIYWIKYRHYAHTSILAECINLLHLIVAALEDEKYGHILPQLATAIKQYRRLVGCGPTPINPSRQSLQSLIERAQRSQYFKHVRTPISPSQLSFLKSPQIHYFFSTLPSNPTLPNNQCICCSQVFLQSFPVSNSNPLIHSLIALEPGKLDKVTLSKFINIVCNKGGGVILGGAITSSGTVRVEGIVYKTQQELQEQQKTIYQAMGTVIPPCFIQLDRVLTLPSYHSLLEPETSARVCFRISARPQFPNQLYFIQIINKGYENVYELHHPDYPKGVFPSQHYVLMQNQYRTRFRYKLSSNSHQNIKCQKPYQGPSKLAKGQSILKSLQGSEQKIQPILIHEDQPKFAHQHTSLLIVGSSKDDRHIQNFQVFLTQQKKLFSLYKPFKNSFQGGGRSVWLLCHKFTLVDLLNLMKGFEQKCEAGTIKVMGVFDNLEICQAKFSEYYQAVLEKRFRERYHKELNKMIWSKKIFYHFGSRGQAIYAYLALEQLQLKPSFVKQIPVLQKVLKI